MDWFFDNVTALDFILIFWAFVLSRIFYDLLKMVWERFRMESCTQCYFKVRLVGNEEVKKIQDQMMLEHYEKSHPQLSTAARIKYGQKEES